MFGLPSVFGLSTVGIVGAVCLAIGAAGGGKFAWTHQEGKVLKAQIAASDMKRNRDKWQGASKAWEDAFHRSEGLRKDENNAAIDAVNQTQNACDKRVADARKSAQALKGLFAKPIPTDPKGCPDPGMFTADDLRPVLRP